MKMFLSCRPFTALLVLSLWLLLSCGSCYGVQSDIDCLKAIKDALDDPYIHLTVPWNFSNNTKGFICQFIGIKCWHHDENKVINIRLSSMGFKGQFPGAIKTLQQKLFITARKNRYNNIKVIAIIYAKCCNKI